jgi:ribose 5-phosphate isomerase B
MMKKLLIAADHAGFELKSQLMAAHPDLPWEDLGTYSSASVDYPDYSERLCKTLIDLTKDFPSTEDALNSGVMGVLVCGSGQGVAIKANRFPSIRAAICWNPEVAAATRAHNNANVLCIGSRFISPNMANDILRTFLGSAFEGGRHSLRVAKLT